jgi:plastocyanin
MRLSIALFAVLALAAVACRDSKGPSSPSPCVNSGAAATVSATDNFAFTPTSVTITVGQSVCWQNTGQLVHTVTEHPVTRFNGNLPSGQAFVHTFGFGGSFTYRCNNHSNMTATVVVNCRPGDLVC